MAIFRKVETSFWTDPMVQEEMTPDDKFFYLYLMTNPKSSMIGIYTITKKQMAFDLGYSPETVNILIDRFQNKLELICYNHESREIAVLNWAKTNLNNGGKPIIDCVKKELSTVKDISLISKIAATIENEKIKLLFDKYDPNIEIEDEIIEENTESIRGVHATSTQRGEEKEKEKEKEEDKDKDKDIAIISKSENKETTKKSNTKIKTNANKLDKQEVFDYFISKQIVNHRQLTNKMNKTITTFCKDNPHLTMIDIKQGIDHYDQMLKSSYEFCNYVWGLEELFSRTEGITKFLDDGAKWLNFVKWEQEKNKPKTDSKNSNKKTAAHNFVSSYDAMNSDELNNAFRDN